MEPRGHHPVVADVAWSRADTQPDLLAQIRKLLCDPDPEQRRQACFAASEIGSRALLEDVLERLDDDDDEVRQATGDALRCWSNTRDLRTALAELLRASEPRETRLRALAAIARVADRRLVPIVIDRLDDPELLRAARRTLVRICARDEGRSRSSWRRWWQKNQDRPRAAWLADALESHVPLLRRIAARDLAGLVGVRSLEHLVDAPLETRSTARQQILEDLEVRAPARRAA